MRLWSIHPSYLDRRGLVALWREGLLAQSVLRGDTEGYKNHPQLTRFRNVANPVGAIASYLRHVVDESDNRGYNFDRSKIVNKRFSGRMPVTRGQLEYEFKHLLGKVKERDPGRHIQLKKVKRIKAHPIFTKVSGDVAGWEVI